MYSLGYDLVVDDDGIIAEAESLAGKTTMFELQLANLVRTLDNVVNTAIMEGNTSDNLAAFVEEVRGLQEEAGDIVEQLKATTANYVTSMDEADSYVY